MASNTILGLYLTGHVAVLTNGLSCSPGLRLVVSLGPHLQFNGRPATPVLPEKGPGFDALDHGSLGSPLSWTKGTTRNKVIVALKAKPMSFPAFRPLRILFSERSSPKQVLSSAITAFACCRVRPCSTPSHHRHHRQERDRKPIERLVDALSLRWTEAVQRSRVTDSEEWVTVVGHRRLVAVSFNLQTSYILTSPVSRQSLSSFLRAQTSTVDSLRREYALARSVIHGFTVFENYAYNVISMDNLTSQEGCRFVNMSTTSTLTDATLVPGSLWLAHRHLSCRPDQDPTQDPAVAMFRAWHDRQSTLSSSVQQTLDRQPFRADPLTLELQARSMLLALSLTETWLREQDVDVFGQSALGHPWLMKSLSSLSPSERTSLFSPSDPEPGQDGGIWSIAGQRRRDNPGSIEDPAGSFNTLGEFLSRVILLVSNLTAYVSDMQTECPLQTGQEQKSVLQGQTSHTPPSDDDTWCPPFIFSSETPLGDDCEGLAMKGYEILLHFRYCFLSCVYRRDWVTVAQFPLVMTLGRLATVFSPLIVSNEILESIDHPISPITKGREPGRLNGDPTETKQTRQKEGRLGVFKTIDGVIAHAALVILPWPSLLVLFRRGLAYGTNRYVKAGSLSTMERVKTFFQARQQQPSSSSSSLSPSSTPLWEPHHRLRDCGRFCEGTEVVFSNPQTENKCDHVSSMVHCGDGRLTSFGRLVAGMDHHLSSSLQRKYDTSHNSTIVVPESDNRGGTILVNIIGGLSGDLFWQHGCGDVKFTSLYDPDDKRVNRLGVPTHSLFGRDLDHVMLVPASPILQLPSEQDSQATLVRLTALAHGEDNQVSEETLSYDLFEETLLGVWQAFLLSTPELAPPVFPVARNQMERKQLSQRLRTLRSTHTLPFQPQERRTWVIMMESDFQAHFSTLDDTIAVKKHLHIVAVIPSSLGMGSDMFYIILLSTVAPSPQQGLRLEFYRSETAHPEASPASLYSFSR